nr:hypothetical protein [Senegalia massiliensis]
MIKIPNLENWDFNLYVDIIHTIEEMQSWYEDDLRKESLKSSEYENNKKIEEQKLFFKAFRKL